MKRLIVLLLAFLLIAGSAAAEDTLPQRSLRITELMASNKETLEDAFGRTPDWIEIYNPTDTAIPLKGVYISDDQSEPNKYHFPDDAVIQPGEYIIVFASGAKKDIADEYHASFKLSASGEMVILSYNGIVLDSLVFEQQQPDASLALDENGEYRITAAPTPGSANVFMGNE